jgi:hypothetical protein
MDKNFANQHFDRHASVFMRRMSGEWNRACGALPESKLRIDREKESGYYV